MSAWSKVLSRFGTEARRATAVTGRWKMALPAVAGTALPGGSAAHGSDVVSVQRICASGRRMRGA